MCSADSTCSGYGPTTDISPLRILKNCGSSSRCDTIRKYPPGIHGSGSSIVLPGFMVRNLYCQKCFPFLVMHSLLVRIGAPAAILTYRARIRYSHDRSTSTSAEKATSKTLFATLCSTVRPQLRNSCKVLSESEIFSELISRISANVVWQ